MELKSSSDRRTDRAILSFIPSISCRRNRFAVDPDALQCERFVELDQTRARARFDAPKIRQTKILRLTRSCHFGSLLDAQSDFYQIPEGNPGL
jgi:hypothetical protein